MIVTRQRPKRKFNPRKLVLPVVAIAALAFALWWPPSQHRIVGFITNGPIAVIAGRVGAFFQPYLAPLHFAAQEQVIADRNHEIEALGGEIEGQRRDLSAKDAEISSLNLQIKQMQAAAQQAASATSTPQPAQQSASAAGGTAEAPPPQRFTDDPKHEAAVWSSMDPEQAAALAEKLPPDFTAKVLALMDNDSAGALLGALPADYAAKVARVAVPVPQN
jgi:flagellar motility protein MotE (MotC chaperone)